MADNLDLLFRIRGDATGAKNATEQARQAVHQLRTSTTSDLKQIQQSSVQSLGSVTQSLSQITANIPVVGRAFSGLSNQLGVVATESAGAATGLASMAGPAALAAGAVVALTAGIGSLVKSFIQLTQQTAEFQGKFFDLSQQVGVTVETLSTLDVIASTTGGNIESVTASLGIFQKNLEAAHDPTSKEAKLLTELGVTSLNTEVALRQVIKGLFDLGQGQKQTAATLELFGRGGRFVNAILKESKGDLDAATAEFQRMGLVVSSESAAAADQFNDSLEILNRQLSAVTRNLVSQSIPAFIVFFEDINRAIQGNKAGWTSWADVIEFEVTVAIAAVESFAQFVASRGALGFFESFEANVRRIAQQSKELRGTLLAEGVAERVAGLTIGGRVGDRPDAGDGKKAAAQAQARAAKEIALAQRALEESTRQHVLELNRQRDKDLKSIDEWETELKRLADEHNQRQEELLVKEEANARRFIKNAEDLQLALIETQQKRTQITNQLINERDKITDEAQKRRDQLELETETRIANLRDTFRQTELDKIKDFVDRGVIAESEGIALTLALLKDEYAQRQKLRDIELEQETTSAKRKADLVDEKIAAERKYTEEFSRLVDERNRKREEEELSAGQRPGGGPGGPGVGEDALAQAAGAAADAAVPPLREFKELTPQVIAGIDAMRDAFGALGQAVGQAVHAFVLFGSAGIGLRKFTAEVLAAVAAQATVKAIFELAEGFAMLALTYFTGNPKYAASASAHFVAAATYGAIAGVAAVAGRMVAGNEFTKGAGGGSGSDSGQGTGQLNPLTLNRNQPPPIVIHVDVKHEEGTIVKTWADNYRSGGVTRELTREDG